MPTFGSGATESGRATRTPRPSACAIKSSSSSPPSSDAEPNALGDAPLVVGDARGDGLGVRGDAPPSASAVAPLSSSCSGAMVTGRGTDRPKSMPAQSLSSSAAESPKDSAGAAKPVWESESARSSSSSCGGAHND